MTKFEDMAQRIAKAQGISLHDAQQSVAQDFPALYRTHRESLRVGAGKLSPRERLRKLVPEQAAAQDTDDRKREARFKKATEPATAPADKPADKVSRPRFRGWA
ncbi:MAG: hypothetical protein ABIG44_07895 [Planctomycetota bacterium]